MLLSLAFMYISLTCAYGLVIRHVFPVRHVYLYMFVYTFKAHLQDTLKANKEEKTQCGCGYK